MRRRWPVVIGVLALALLLLALTLGQGCRARASAERVRRALAREGFKLALSEFNLAVPEEVLLSSKALTAAGHASQNGAMLQARSLVQPVGTDGMVVIWREEGLTNDVSQDLWLDLRAEFTTNAMLLDEACRVAFAGAIGFEPNPGPNGDLVLPYLAEIRSLAAALLARHVLLLHDNLPANAWTNLVALTRLGTAWNPEPAEISHLVRFGCIAVAQSALWQALQFQGWSEQQLQQLQQEWETARFFQGLPETAALSRALMIAAWQRERAQPVDTRLAWGQIASDVFVSPGNAWVGFRSVLQTYRYRGYGTYDDETAFLLAYRQREIELRQALTMQSWKQIRTLPGATNSTASDARQAYRFRARAGARWAGLSFARQGPTLLRRASEAEARRRLSVVAIALERYRIQNGDYPEKLERLVPRFLKIVPDGFMDGKPLNYTRTKEGHFVLGATEASDLESGEGTQVPPGGRSSFSAALPGGFMIWPRPVAAEEFLRSKAPSEP